jgi:hypothetical protein
MRKDRPLKLYLRHHPGRIAVLLALLALAAAAGAYGNWILWDDEKGFVLSLGAVAILAAAGLVGLVGFVVAGQRGPEHVHRGAIRSVALGVAVVGVGILLGQKLGPSREPLIYQFDGTMTLTLTSPIAATAKSPSTCINVASATEFSVDGDSNMRLDTPDQPFIAVYLDVGDRWVVRDGGAPRRNGVWFRVDMTGALVTDSGKPATTTLLATPSSTIEATFSNAGGSVRFAGLVDQEAADPAGAASPLAGTVSWTCGPVR